VGVRRGALSLLSCGLRSRRRSLRNCREKRAT
jgi:hypothetical protein